MASDLQNQLQAALGSAYRIERELGVGGMATVFAGIESSLGRRVAIKVLQPELVAELSTDRFAREVRLAASLQQANIVPLLSAGEAGGFSYYTMPLVEGNSLRARLATGIAVPLNEGLSILKDVARALAYAHNAGIVHRDIKPDNILLSGGTAVVSDFGIAKAMDVARAAVSADYTITTPGSSLGTPGYMAPEQVAGDFVDHRADIYAWGVVAWELLAGRHPFGDRPTRQAMLSAHLTEPPPPIQAHVPGLPPSIAALVMSTLSKDPSQRPQSASELSAGLEGMVTPSGAVMHAPQSSRRVLYAIAAVAVIVAVLVAQEVFSGRSNPPAVVDAPPSIAVLPLENIGGDSAQEYFADGMTDELATALGRIPGLKVAARSAAYRFKGRTREIDPRQVGSELGVRYLLSGTVRRDGQQIRVSATLTGAADAFEIWSKSYARAADDVFALQDTLATAITSALADRLGSPGGLTPTAAAPRGTTNNKAYDLYLQGNYFLNRRRPGLEGAVRSFQAAIAEDRNYARAYAGLANSLALLRYFGETATEVQPVIDHARRALSLDSTLADARVALGILYMAIGRLAAAKDELSTAVAIEPGNAAAHFQLGRSLTYLWRFDDAIVAFERAKSIEPYQATTATWLGYLLTYRSDSSHAHAEWTRAWELDSSSAVVQLFASVTALEAGRPADAARVVRNSPTRNALTRGAFAYVLGKVVHPDSSRALIAEIQRRGAARWNDYWNMALAALALPDTALALDALEKAVERNEPVFGAFPFSSNMYDSIRDAPRFAALMRRVDVPDYRPIRRSR